MPDSERQQHNEFTDEATSVGNTLVGRVLRLDWPYGSETALFAFTLMGCMRVSLYASTARETCKSQILTNPNALSLYTLQWQIDNANAVLYAALLLFLLPC
jgi:hypothetical protein